MSVAVVLLVMCFPEHIFNSMSKNPYSESWENLEFYGPRTVSGFALLMIMSCSWEGSFALCFGDSSGSQQQRKEKSILLPPLQLITCYCIVECSCKWFFIPKFLLFYESMKSYVSHKLGAEQKNRQRNGYTSFKSIDWIFFFETWQTGLAAFSLTP